MDMATVDPVRGELLAVEGTPRRSRISRAAAHLTG
jgi:hypothetical protein